MRFFSQKFAHEGMPDGEARKVVAEYQRHLESIVPLLPDSVARLATQIDLHDGLIRRAELDTMKARLRLELLCGDRLRGYSDLDLDYEGVALSDLDHASLASIARDRRSELLYDEIDLVDEGAFVHRLLFWPNGEFSVVFRNLKISMKDRAARSLEFVGDPYLELDPDGTGA